QAREPWPADADALADWDCYRCNLDLVLLSDATRAELEQHFRCVPEQVQWHVPAPAPAQGVAPADDEPPALRERAAALWREQLALLARPAIAPHTVEATRRALRGLLRAMPSETGAAALSELDALPSPVEAGMLAAWAATRVPGGAAAAPATAEDPRRAEDGGTGERPQRVLKVGQEKVDRLMDLIGEMVVAKNGLPYLAQRAEAVFGQRELAREIKAQYAVIHRIAEDMQRAIMEVRMLPVGVVFQRFGRLVRDLSRRLGKEVQLQIEGEDTEADKNVIEALADPLIHILRNSLDHGIEQPARRLAAGKPAHGTIRIVARQEADRVVIEIADDGAGVDAARVRAKAVERGLVPADRAAALSDEQAVQLIFLPGFSTAETVSDLSGRGVGMDVVRTAVERVNGQVTLASRPGLGTTLRLSLPLSMAVTNVMVIESAGRRFGVPMDLIVETVRVHRDDIHHFKQARTTVLRGRIVPLRDLNDMLALDAAQATNDDGELAVLVVRIGGENAGLVVDQFLGASDIILKPLEGVLAGMTGFAGTALMGDGGVLMILNPKELL
ncbi:chemotaxis protein CheA, partial [Aquabacterium sp. A7-Y]|uniref:chemotaxis protein CheA n=1 Tax=Aquabacterium sp. A7-Y TaxID=1349605 RepID=UPI00223E1841